MKITQLSGGKYKISYYVGPKQRRVVGTNKKQLEALANKEIYEFNQKGITPNQKNLSITFKEFAFGEYLTNHVNVHHKNPKREGYRLKQLCATFGSYPLSYITHQSIEKWLGAKKLVQEPAGINRYLTTLKSVFNKAIQWEYLQKNPAKFVKKIPREAKLERYLTTAEIQRVVVQTQEGERIRDFFEVAILTGIRKANLEQLTPENVRLDARVPFIYVPENKSDRPYSVPMHPRVIAIMKRRLAVVKPGEPILDTTNLRKDWEDLKKKADLKGATIHTLRHTFASKLAMLGVNLYDIAKLMNHSDPKLTLRYAHLSPDHRAAAVNKLDFN